MSGRRAPPPLRPQLNLHDVQAGAVSLFYWLFGMFLDEQHKPSMSRIMFALWTAGGWAMIVHEIELTRAPGGGVPISNAAWTAWWAAEGAIALAVFGPRIASYFGAGAAGAISSGAIGAAVREAVTAVLGPGAPPIVPAPPAPPAPPAATGETPITDINPHTGSQG